MKEFLITLFLGAFGVHRFMKKQYVIGVVYLLTMGLFGIGWAVDSITAFVRMVKGTEPQQQEKQNIYPERGVQPTEQRQLVKSFNTEIVGTFANCGLDKKYKRDEIIASLNDKSNLYLEYWEYKGEPAYYVCSNGLDAGCVRAELAKVLHDKYLNCEFVVTLRGNSYYNSHDDLIQKIRIDIYGTCTQTELEGMTKEEILEVGTKWGYTMITTKNNTKAEIIRDFLAQKKKQEDNGTGI